MPDDEQPGTGGDGSYTARPSKEPPPEGVTRDEDEEAVERTGGEHEVAHGDDAGDAEAEEDRADERPRAAATW